MAAANTAAAALAVAGPAVAAPNTAAVAPAMATPNTVVAAPTMAAPNTDPLVYNSSRESSNTPVEQRDSGRRSTAEAATVNFKVKNRHGKGGSRPASEEVRAVVVAEQQARAAASVASGHTLEPKGLLYTAPVGGYVSKNFDVLIREAAEQWKKDGRGKICHVHVMAEYLPREEPYCQDGESDSDEDTEAHDSASDDTDFDELSEDGSDQGDDDSDEESDD